MNRITWTVSALTCLLFPFLGKGQSCDPSQAPDGLQATYTAGVGVVLEWNPVAFSVGMQIKATTPGGVNITRRFIGSSLTQTFIPEGSLSPGLYTWQIQAACSSTPPYDVTPISGVDSFLVTGSGDPCPSTVMDVDGNMYNAVQIGSQCWTAENLRTEHFQNGDSIPRGALLTSSFSVYDNLVSNKAIYGLLYNWYAVADTRGICPLGWHVPTDPELTELILGQGGVSLAGGALKASGTTLWAAPNTGATNSSGFTALPSGMRSGTTTFTFSGLGTVGYYWTATQSSADLAIGLGLISNSAAVYRGDHYGKGSGFAVRCVKDE